MDAVDLGYSGWMYDYGEYVSPETSFANGQLGLQMHNAYPVEYQVRYTATGLWTAVLSYPSVYLGS